MDEVEPALDDINLHRFISLIGGFAKEAQVLVVTHQKRTMEVAGMMYGVSMSKEGTSMVLAQRIDAPSATGTADEAGATVGVPEPDAVR
jgi:chromosome segregation protein